MQRKRGENYVSFFCLCLLNVAADVRKYVFFREARQKVLSIYMYTAQDRFLNLIFMCVKTTYQNFKNL